MYAIIVFLIVLIAVTVYFLVTTENKQLKDNFNKQIKGLTTSSAKYLVNNYNLYYSSPTLKHKALVDNYLNENTILKKFQIIDAEGKIVFDSLAYQNSKTATGNVDQSLLDFSRKAEPTYIYEDGKIKTVVVPCFEDWGSHKYTIIFTPSFIEVEDYINQFNAGAMLIGILIAVVVVSMVSAFILMEQYRLKRAEKKKTELLDKQRREFLMLASHNLRTPLTKINGYISLLTELKLKKEELELIIPTNEAIAKLDEIVDNILTITSVQDDKSTRRIGSKVHKLLDIISVILEKNTVSVAEKNLKVSVEVTPKDLGLELSKKYLDKLLTAIIVNAIKFNKNNGSVNIKVSSDKKVVHFVISDTGIGIDEKELKNIYTIFHRGSSDDPLIYDYDGTGVGLYMSKLLVDYLDGKIWFKSVLNEGTTFYIDIPINISGPVSKAQVTNKK